MNCDHCGEDIADGARCGHVEGSNLHHECAVRLTLGSAGHQLGLCSCYGGILEDPPHMSPRESAKAAMTVASMKRGGTPPVTLAALALFIFPENAGYYVRSPPGIGEEDTRKLAVVEQLARIPGIHRDDLDTVKALAVELTRNLPSIVCPKCMLRSYNPNDVQNRYCGACHEYHDSMDFHTEKGDSRVDPERP